MDRQNLALTVRDGELDTVTLGKLLAQSGYFQDAREAAQAIVKVLAGRELGFPAIASMTGIYIVKGRITLSANLMAAAIKRTGRYNYRVLKMDNDECAIEFFDGKDSMGVSRFTMADAKRAGTQNTDKFPRNMLFARAMSNGCKWYCPDVFCGPVYTPDELGAKMDSETGEVVEMTPPQPPRTHEPPTTPKAQLAQPSTPEGQTLVAASAARTEDPEQPQQPEPQQQAPATNGNGARRNTPQASPKGINFEDYDAWCQDFASRHPAWSKDGKADKAHIGMSVYKCGFTSITPENWKQVQAEMEDRATQHEQPQAA